MKPKYNQNFERDFKWYLSMRHIFNFDGVKDYTKETVIVSKIDNKTNEIIDIYEYPYKTFKEQFPNVNITNTILVYLGTNIIASKPPDNTVKGSFYTYKFNMKSEKIIQYSKNGVSGVEAFSVFDSKGVILPTKHPNLLKSLLKTKGSANLHIKMYAEDRAACNFSGLEFRALCIKFKAPYWFREAVENQKFKYL